MTRSILLGALLALGATMAAQAHARYFTFDPEGANGGTWGTTPQKQ